MHVMCARPSVLCHAKNFLPTGKSTKRKLYQYSLDYTFNLWLQQLLTCSNDVLKRSSVYVIETFDLKKAENINIATLELRELRLSLL